MTETIDAKLDQINTRLVKIWDKLNETPAAKPATAGGRKGNKWFKFDGSFPVEYSGTLAGYTATKDADGNVVEDSFSLVVPVGLLDSETCFAQKDGHFIVPVETRSGDVQLKAVPVGAEMSEEIESQFGRNRGLGIVFIDPGNFKSIFVPNKLKAPNAYDADGEQQEASDVASQAAALKEDAF